LTPRQQSLVRHSFAAIHDSALPLALLFYGRLFDLQPRLRSLFPNDLSTQGQKLIAMFDTILASLDQPESLRPQLRQLGARHAALGVQPADYDTLARAFLWSLAHALEAAFSPETRDAWQTLLHEISAEMQAGAA
jgi:methyl-accepting chemotaxis protein